MKKLLSLMFVGVLVLGGCSSPKAANKSVSCSMDAGGLGKMTYKLGYDSKNIVNALGIKLAMKGDTAITDEEVKSMKDTYKEQMDGVAGVDYSVDVAKDKLSLELNINIDLKKYDVKKDQLQMLGQVAGDGEVALDKAKVKDVIANFETMGLKCGEVK